MKWKRAFDLLFLLLVLPFIIPLILFIGFLIKVFERGPIFFKQERVGLRGRKFLIYKFRTMYLDSEKILRKYLEEDKEAMKEWKMFKKLKRDPRVTPLGKILRRLSLDELPQVFNVLKGEMSFVGPRPYLESELKDLSPLEREKILSVKPGITGLWQVSGRSDLSFRDRVKLDLKYVKEVSFLTDLKILLKTLKTIISGKGAY